MRAWTVRMVAVVTIVNMCVLMIDVPPAESNCCPASCQTPTLWVGINGKCYTTNIYWTYKTFFTVCKCPQCPPNKKKPLLAPLNNSITVAGYCTAACTSHPTNASNFGGSTNTFNAQQKCNCGHCTKCCAKCCDSDPC
jgi:hypothetical protein